MPMSYRMYVERHKALDSACVAAVERFENANSAWGKAFTEYKAADRNLSRADEETRPERERELNASAERLDSAAKELNDSSEQRERAWAERSALEKDYPAFDAAQEQGISPSDSAAPSDMSTPREDAGKFMAQAKGVIDTGLMTGGMIAQIVTATPQVHEQATPVATIQEVQKEVFRETVSAREHDSESPQARATATPEQSPGELTEKEHAKERESEKSKAELDSLIKAIGSENKMTSASGMKSKRDESIAEWDKGNAIYDNAVENAPRRSADNVIAPPQESLAYTVNNGGEFRAPISLPDPDRSASTFPVDLKSSAGILDPEHQRSPAAEQPSAEQPAPEKAVAAPDGPSPSRGIPNPDPPASALAAQAPANDNTPRSPANDNTSRSPANDNDPSF